MVYGSDTVLRRPFFLLGNFANPEKAMKYLCCLENVLNDILERNYIETGDLPVSVLLC